MTVDPDRSVLSVLGLESTKAGGFDRVGVGIVDVDLNPLAEFDRRVPRTALGATRSGHRQHDSDPPETNDGPGEHPRRLPALDAHRKPPTRSEHLI